MLRPRTQVEPAVDGAAARAPWREQGDEAFLRRLGSRDPAESAAAQASFAVAGGDAAEWLLRLLGAGLARERRVALFLWLIFQSALQAVLFIPDMIFADHYEAVDRIIKALMLLGVGLLAIGSLSSLCSARAFTRELRRGAVAAARAVAGICDPAAMPALWKLGRAEFPVQYVVRQVLNTSTVSAARIEAGRAARVALTRLLDTETGARMASKPPCRWYLIEALRRVVRRRVWPDSLPETEAAFPHAVVTACRWVQDPAVVALLQDLAQRKSGPPRRTPPALVDAARSSLACLEARRRSMVDSRALPRPACPLSPDLSALPVAASPECGHPGTSRRGLWAGRGRDVGERRVGGGPAQD